MPTECCQQSLEGISRYESFGQVIGKSIPVVRRPTLEH
jgi:hypothetical protein